MATSSTVPAALDYLAAQIPVQLPVGAQLCDGMPGEYPSAAFVALLGWKLEGAPATLGGPVRFGVEEHYTIAMLARGYAGDSMSAARLVASQLFDAVQSTVRADPTFGGAIRVSWVESADAQQGPTTPSGWACEIEVAVHCEARLS